MNSYINFRNMHSSREITGYVDYRLSFAFSRLKHKIETLTVTLSDINGPKSGIDKQCRIVVKPMGLKQIVITERRDDIRQAIDRSIARASQTLSRRMKRRKLPWKRSSTAKKSRTEVGEDKWTLSDISKSISI